MDVQNASTSLGNVFNNVELSLTPSCPFCLTAFCVGCLRLQGVASRSLGESRGRLVGEIWVSKSVEDYQRAE